MGRYGEIWGDMSSAPPETLVLRFIPHPSPVAARWVAAVRHCQAAGLGIKYKRRCYSFPRDARTPASVAADIAASVEVLNAHEPGVVSADLLPAALRPAPEAAAASAKAQSKAAGMPLVVVAVPVAPPPALSAAAEDATEESVAAVGATVAAAEDAASTELSQEQLNGLHKRFEVLRGSIEAPAPFFACAPPPVQEALQDFNLHIHRLEDLHRQAERLAMGKRPTPRIVVAFDPRRPRTPLSDGEMRHFTVRMEFGAVYLNYCVVGKHLMELFQDDDEDECGDENVRPQRTMSADAQCYFGPSMSEEEAAQKLSDFHDWLRASPHRRRSWCPLEQQQLALGRIPVAALDRSHPSIAGLSEEQIVDKIADFQELCSLRVVPHARLQQRPGP